MRLIILTVMFVAATACSIGIANAVSPPSFATANEAFDYIAENTVEDGDLIIDSEAPLKVRVFVETVPGELPEIVRSLGEHAAVMAVFTAFIFTDTVDSIEVRAFAKPLKPEFAPVVDPAIPLVTIITSRHVALRAAKRLMGVSNLKELTQPSPYLETQWVFAPALSNAFYNDQGAPTREQLLDELSRER